MGAGVVSPSLSSVASVESVSLLSVVVSLLDVACVSASDAEVSLSPSDSVGERRVGLVTVPLPPSSSPPLPFPMPEQATNIASIINVAPAIEEKMIISFFFMVFLPFVYFLVVILQAARNCPPSRVFAEFASSTEIIPRKGKESQPKSFDKSDLVSPSC